VRPFWAGIRERVARLWGTLAGGRRDGDLEEELRLHAALTREEAARRGKAPVESPPAVSLTSPSVDRALERLRDQRGLPWLDALLADVVFGWRQVTAHPTVSLAAVVSLGLAMGASTGAFRLVDAVLLRPLPVETPDRLFFVQKRAWDARGQLDTREDFDYPTFREYRTLLAGRADAMVIGSSYPESALIGSGGDGERVLLQYLSGNVFPVFGLQPAAGRLLTPADDDAPGAQPVAVLSHDFWTRRFQQDPKAVGTVLRLGDRVFEIVGVAPRGFIGTEPGLVPAVWIPATMNTRALESRGWSWFEIWVRPNPDVTPTAIQQILEAALEREHRERVKQLAADTPRAVAEALLAERIRLQAAGRGSSPIQKHLAVPLGIIAALVGLVLLMACATVGNLLVGLTLAREREVAVRVALGAGRARLVQLVLVEGAILAVGAAALAVLVAGWAPSMVITMIEPIPIPVRLVLDLSWRVAAFGAALTVLVTALVGAAPALRAASVVPQAALRGGSTRRSGRLVGSLVVAQMAFGAFVLFAAVLFVATFHRLSSRPAGFSYDDVFVLSADSREGDERAVGWRRVEEAVRQLPGVEAAAVAGWPLLSGNGWTVLVRAEPGAEAREEYFLGVGPQIFSVLRMGLLDGRDFRPTDVAPALDAQNRPVAGVGIVNEAFARRYYEGRSPLGRVIAARQAKDVDAPLEIVGLVRDTPYRGVRDPIRPIVFVPWGRVGEGTLMVRAAAGSVGIAPTLGRVLQREWPGARVRDLRPASDYVQSQLVVERLLARLCSAFALLGLLLAGIGLYAVVNDAVVRRRREIGVRMALGARALDVVRHVTSGALRLVTIGLVIGLAGGVAFGRAVGSILFEVAPTDWGPLALPLLILAAIFGLASLSPSIHAVRTNPTETLRCD
jgi:predicted permease